MSSSAVARNLVQELGAVLAPDQPVKVKLDRLYRRLSTSLPSLSPRRVRALYDGEARRIDYDEMRAIEEAIASEEARREHKQFLATTHRLAVLLAAEGASLSGEQMAALHRIAGGPADVQGHQSEGARSHLG